MLFCTQLFIEQPRTLELQMLRTFTVTFLISVGTAVSASAQSSLEDFSTLVNNHMAKYCPKIEDKSDRSICELEHQFPIIKAMNASAMAANAEVFRALGNEQKADEIRAKMIVMLKEAGS